MMNKTEYKAVVLLSGGIDSAVTLGKVLTLHLPEDVLCLIIDYNQRQRIQELKAAWIIAQHYGVDYKDIEIMLPKRLNDKDALLPGRNAAFLTIACAYAESVGAQTVYIGANKDDQEFYPDCRSVWLDHFNHLMSWSEMKVRVKALLIELSKIGVVSLGKELGVPLQSTWSCYNHGNRHCGKCDTCKLRAEAFKKADTFLEDMSEI